MKKIVCTLLALSLCIALLFGINKLRTENANRTEFETEYAKIDLEFHEREWYVFTRADLHDNPELEEVWIEPELQIDFILENNIFLDGVLFYSDVDSWLEVLLAEGEPSNNGDYSTLSEEELEALSDEVAAGMGAEDNGVLITRHGLKFIWFEYFGEGYYPEEYYIRNYYTEVDGKAYEVQFVSDASFVSDEYLRMSWMLNSMRIVPSSSAPAAEIETAPSEIWDEEPESRAAPSATELIKQIIIILVIYSLPIVIYRFFIIGEPVDEQKARKITVVYTCLAAALMLTAVIMGAGDKITLGALLLWSHMNYRILIDY
ncbi:MAG: hypothetical protein IJE09_05125 [Oscillospiraceae bacterium]|nr:hypothetical protein [Oscillospiraceae bacterium]